jgi:signal transduction histidine kinase
MKFFWKIYFSFTILFLLSFGFFGTWMIQMTFEKSYQRVLEEAEQENWMYQLAFEMNLNALDEIYRNDDFLAVTASTITQNLSGSGTVYRLYNVSGQLLYESQNHAAADSGILDMLSKENTCVYELLRSGDQTWLVFACRSDVEGSVYLLENLKNISSIYEEREAYYDWYTIIMLILAVLTLILVFVITHFLTASIAQLSETTRRFTEGELDARASEEGGDEIAALASDFNQMADALSEKMEELTMQARRQEDFTASFAHELKTPLTSIIGYADMLRTVDCTPEEIREAVNYIFQQGKRLESLSFKLLELIVADRQEYDFRAIGMCDLVNDAVQMTESKRSEKGISLEKEVEDGWIEGERDLLVSALTNFLDNARKAVPDGGHIRMRGRPYVDGYVLGIFDDGCGMEPQELARITEAFYMVDKSRARKEGGAGLGMTLCSRILALHEVHWKIFSRPGEGTAILMRFDRKGEKQHATVE